MTPADYRVVITSSWPDSPPDLWRAELWRSPYNGKMLACTVWRTTKAAAAKDGKRYLRVPEAPDDPR